MFEAQMLTRPTTRGPTMAPIQSESPSVSKAKQAPT